MSKKMPETEAEIEEVVIRSMRSGFTWLDNVMVDDWAYLIGTDIFSVYTLYCRRAMNQTQSTKLAQEVIAEHFHISKTTVSDALRILEWCDLVKMVRRHRSISTIYLKNTKPLTPELRASLRASIAEGNDYMHLRTMLMARLDNFLSLGERLDLFMAKSEKQKIKLIRADEHEATSSEHESMSSIHEAKPELAPTPNSPPKVATALDSLWQEVKERLQMQMTQATYDSWVRPTQLMEIEGNRWLIQCESSFAQDWLENRLNGTLIRTANGVSGEEVELKFTLKE